MCAGGLFGCYVVDVGSGDPEAALVFWLAADTGAVRIYASEVVGERGVAEVEGAG